VPVAGDWDANRVTAVGVFRPDTATWYLLNANTPGVPDSVQARQRSMLKSAPVRRPGPAQQATFRASVRLTSASPK
jgi:hypothetical protein